MVCKFIIDIVHACVVSPYAVNQDVNCQELALPFAISQMNELKHKTCSLIVTITSIVPHAQSSLPQTSDS